MDIYFELNMDTGSATLRVISKTKIELTVRCVVQSDHALTSSASFSIKFPK